MFDFIFFKKKYVNDYSIEFKKIKKKKKKKKKNKKKIIY